MAIGIAMVATATTQWMTVLGVVLAGGPLGPMFPNFIAFFMSLGPPEMRGRAAGLFTMSIYGGQFLSPLISAPLVARFGLSGGMLGMAVLPSLGGVFVAMFGRQATLARRNA
ncbi:hypothetical protein [Pseudooceanicola sp.]|uniref:hypothetical protein n=1 Tax=Pseudooceanicola sp. TaxID=1914328 RepID=UPI002610D91A|nr:hypothetical protein [Pseudooceanicola sp.]MDF1857081.1 hypothetical protein [Pseudooceanicola sp.]